MSIQILRHTKFHEYRLSNKKSLYLDQRHLAAEENF